MNPNKRFQYQAIGSLQYTRQDQDQRYRREKIRANELKVWESASSNTDNADIGIKRTTQWTKEDICTWPGVCGQRFITFGLKEKRRTNSSHQISPTSSVHPNNGSMRGHPPFNALLSGWLSSCCARGFYVCLSSGQQAEREQAL